MADQDGTSERLDALEARISYQDETIEALNQTMTAQWSVIERLKREVAAIGERVEDAVSGPGPVDRPPPHY